MGGQQQNAKKGKSRRVDKGKIARYWNVNHIENMTRRAQRVYQRIIKDEMDVVKAREHAQRCASAHGPSVEGRLARWMKEQ